MSVLAMKSAYAELEAAYIARNPKSQEIYQHATTSLPGGNTRTVLFYHPFPLATVHAEGCYLHSADGHVYTDFLGEYTAGLCGHSHPVVLEAVRASLEKGVNFGSQHQDEAILGELIKIRFPSIDLLRFTNSGTEANLNAIGAARALTGRKKVVVFEGAYHGGVLSFPYGKHMTQLNVPFEYLVATYNEYELFDELIDENRDDIAVVIVEPMLGSAGAIPGQQAWLQHLRERTSQIGAILIFDEVMTSRLYSGGGLQGQFQIKPDMTTLGKYIGGGMSFGAFGGRRDIMEQFDPRHGHRAHAGTFNNNTLTMAAGCAVMKKVFTTDIARAVNDRGDRLRAKLNEISRGTLLKVTGVGSIMAFSFTQVAPEDIHSPADTYSTTGVFHDVLHLELLAGGVYIARRGFIALSLEIDGKAVALLVDAVQNFVDKYRASLSIP